MEKSCLQDRWKISVLAATKDSKNEMVEWSTGAVTVGRAYLLSGSFGCRCLTSLALAPFPALPHQTGHDHLGHPAFRQHSSDGMRIRTFFSFPGCETIRLCL